MSTRAVLAAETFEPHDADASAKVLDFVRAAEQRGREVVTPSARLVSADGLQAIELPDELFRVLVLAAKSLAQNKAVTVAPIEQQLTTMEAAEFLGVSRPTLIKLLEGGAIPFTTVGRHRRVKLADLLGYQRRQAQVRAEALTEMARIAREGNLYESTALPPEAFRRGDRS